ncbi:MAG: hypothetical protein Q4A74_07525 [Cardiobacteriaceae bacterium]|nr:hypothetical protein [Cardiobacteriaceae bacterium]
MFKAFMLFILTYLLFSTTAYFLLPNTVALHFTWYYPLLAGLACACASVYSPPPRTWHFALLVLPFVYLLNLLSFIAEAIWYLGFSTLRDMQSSMLPMVLSSLRENLDWRTILFAILHISLSFLILFIACHYTRRRT